MRVLAWAVLASLTGCLAPVDVPEPFAPVHLEGEWWVPTTSGRAPATQTLTFDIPEGARRVRAVAQLSEEIAGWQVTGPLAEFTIRLVDAAGREWEESRAPLGSQQLNIETGDASTGPATLLLEARGASDGSAKGDRVFWTIDVTWITRR